MPQATFDFEGAVPIVPTPPSTPRGPRRPAADAFLEAFIGEHRARGKRVHWADHWGRLRPAVRSALTRRVDKGLPRDWAHRDPWQGLTPAKRLAAYVRLCADGCPIADAGRVDQMARHVAEQCRRHLPADYFGPVDPFYNSHNLTKMVQEQVQHASYRQCLLAVARHCPTLFCPED